jgi:hypothetical protein
MPAARSWSAAPSGRAARLVWALVASTLLLAPAGTSAQIQSVTPESYVRVEWAVEQGKGGQRVAGYIYNPRDLWANRLQLLVEAVDASGQVVGSKLVSIFPDVPPRNRSYFETAPPATGPSYRVTVRSVDWRGYGAGGG